MAICEKAHFILELELYTLIFLWITAIINFLDVMAFKFHFLEMTGGFWDLIGVSFHMLWTGCSVIFCAIGLSGFDMFKPQLLKYCFRYLLCSAISKTIFAFLLLASSNDDNFYRAFAYATNEPLLLIFFDTFIKKLTLSSYILFHVMAIFYLLCGAFMVHRLRNQMLRRHARIEESDVPENEIP